MYGISAGLLIFALAGASHQTAFSSKSDTTHRRGDTFTIAIDTALINRILRDSSISLAPKGFTPLDTIIVDHIAPSKERIEEVISNFRYSDTQEMKDDGSSTITIIFVEYNSFELANQDFDMQCTALQKVFSAKNVKCSGKKPMRCVFVDGAKEVPTYQDVFPDQVIEPQTIVLFQKGTMMLRIEEQNFNIENRRINSYLAQIK
jgi:hypothetical protein